MNSSLRISCPRLTIHRSAAEHPAAIIPLTLPTRPTRPTILTQPTTPTLPTIPIVLIVLIIIMGVAMETAIIITCRVSEAMSDPEIEL